jgi:hypothetical protein
MADVIGSTNIRARMRAVLDESVRTDEAIDSDEEGERFLVLNPDYHDGKRPSFLVLPGDFCQTMLLGPSGIRPEQIWPIIGRVLTVTDRGIVLTIVSSRQVVHVTCDVADDRTLGGVTFGTLQQAARQGEWLVPWEEFDALFVEVAKRHSLTTTWRQLMQLPPNVVQGKGGVG